MSILCFAIISEAEYPALLDLCDKPFPPSYQAYSLMLEGYAESAAALEMTTVEVKIDPQMLKKWLNGRAATPSDLLRYAYYLHHRMLTNQDGDESSEEIRRSP